MPKPEDQPKVDAGMAPPTDTLAAIQALLVEFMAQMDARLTEQQKINASTDASLALLICTFAHF